MGGSFIKKGEKYFVRIDYKEGDKELDNEVYQAHLEYLKKVAVDRYFIGGGFLNIKGGMIIFTAENKLEAKMIVEKDPIIEKGYYKYELFEWELILTSK